MSSFKSVLISCLCLVSVLTATPIHRVRELDFVPATHFQSLHGPIFPLTRSNTSEEVGSSSDQSCKLHRRAQDLDIWRARPYELLFPIRHAAAVLRELYYGLLLQANKQWSLQALLPTRWIRQGNFELFSHSVGGPIPWSVVARFADRMVCTTKLGWIGTYDDIRQNATTNEVDDAIPPTANNQLSLPQPHPTKSRTNKETRSTELKKRSHLRPIQIKIQNPIVPMAVAAPHVKAFFDAVTIEAFNTWTSRKEAALLTVTQAPFQLTVSSLGADIPWSTLATLANHFATLADRFWVNTFDAFFQVADSAVVIAFSLRILKDVTEQGPMTISVPSKRNLPVPAVAQSSPDTPSLHHHHPSLLQSRTSSSLSLRSPSRLNTEFTKTLSIIPAAVAAQHLEDFYNIIALKIETGQLAHRPPSKRITISLWDFELTFESDSMVVPLSFVQAFAIDMAEWSTRQWTGFYEAVVTGEGALSGLVILIRMRLKGAGGSALVKLNP